MIDGITATTDKASVSHLQHHPLLNWGRWTAEESGTALARHCNADLWSLIFHLYDSGMLRVRGSLHRFFRKGAANDTLFTYADLCAAIQRLCQILELRPEDVNLEKFEVGLNIPTGNVPAIDIIDAAICYKTKPLGAIYTGTRITGKIAEFDDYRIKIYEKDTYLLRFEISSKRARYFQKFLVFNLKDFLDRKAYKLLFDHLIDVLEDVIFFDKKWVPYFPAEVALNLSHPSYWAELEYHRRQSMKSSMIEHLEENSIEYWGEFLKKKMLDLWPLLVEEEPTKYDDAFENSTINYTWKNGNASIEIQTGRSIGTEFSTGILSGYALIIGHYYRAVGRRGLARILVGQRRIRSPPDSFYTAQFSHDIKSYHLPQFDC